MRFLISISSLVLALTSAVMAGSVLKSYIVSFPNGAPDSLVEEAKKAVLGQGGKITHEYNIIQGFACEMPEVGVSSVQTLGTAEWPAFVEGDGVVTTQNDDAGF